MDIWLLSSWLLIRGTKTAFVILTTLLSSWHLSGWQICLSNREKRPFVPDNYQRDKKIFLLIVIRVTKCGSFELLNNTYKLSKFTKDLQATKCVMEEFTACMNTLRFSCCSCFAFSSSLLAMAASSAFLFLSFCIFSSELFSWVAFFFWNLKDRKSVEHRGSSRNVNIFIYDNSLLT